MLFIATKLLYCNLHFCACTVYGIDIDIQTDEATAYILGELLKEYEVQPVTFSGNEKIRSHFGKFLVDGMEVEVMGDIQKKPSGMFCKVSIISVVD